MFRYSRMLPEASAADLEGISFDPANSYAPRLCKQGICVRIKSGKVATRPYAVREDLYRFARRMSGSRLMDGALQETTMKNPAQRRDKQISGAPREYCVQEVMETPSGSWFCPSNCPSKTRRIAQVNAAKQAYFQRERKELGVDFQLRNQQAVGSSPTGGLQPTQKNADRHASKVVIAHGQKSADQSSPSRRRDLVELVPDHV